MSQEVYADPVTKDGPRFHSIIPVSENSPSASLESDRDKGQNSAPPVVRNRGRGNAHNSNRPLPKAQRGSGAQDTKQLGLRP